MPVLIGEYADSLRKSGRATAERALSESERQNAELLPQGVDTDGMLLFVGEAGGQPVGWIWVGLPAPANGRELAWIFNVRVDPEHRGKGYGRSMIEAVERKLASRGVTRLGLNVFADNNVAIRLYESLGFEVTAQQMAKSIAATGPA